MATTLPPLVRGSNQNYTVNLHSVVFFGICGVCVRHAVVSVQLQRAQTVNGTGDKLAASLYSYCADEAIPSRFSLCHSSQRPGTSW